MPCLQQRELGFFSKGKHLRLWLASFDPADWQTPGKNPLDKNDAFDRPTGDVAHKARQASVSAALLLEAPRTLLDLSLASFLCGLGVYLGLLWTRSLGLQAAGTDNRNVFIVYVLAGTVCFLGIFALPELFKKLDVGSFWLDGVKRYYENLGTHRRVGSKPVTNISQIFNKAAIQARLTSRLQQRTPADDPGAPSFYKKPLSTSHLHQQTADDRSGAPSVKSRHGHEVLANKDENVLVMRRDNDPTESQDRPSRNEPNKKI